MRFEIPRSIIDNIPSPNLFERLQNKYRLVLKPEVLEWCRENGVRTGRVEVNVFHNLYWITIVDPNKAIFFKMRWL
jgi:hypothetical protein